MPFTFSEFDKKYRIVEVKGKEEVIIFLKRLGIVSGNYIRNISKNGSGFIVSVNEEARFALDRALANKIKVEAA